MFRTIVAEEKGHAGQRSWCFRSLDHSIEGHRITMVPRASSIIPSKACYSMASVKGASVVSRFQRRGLEWGEIDRRRCHLRTSRQLRDIPMAHCHCLVGSLDIAEKSAGCLPLGIHTTQHCSGGRAFTSFVLPFLVQPCTGTPSIEQPHARVLNHRYLLA